MLALTLAAALAAGAPTCRPRPSQSQDVGWLRRNCHVTPRDDARVAQAERILARLVTLKGLPSFTLVVIEDFDRDRAYVTATRAIVLSRSALELCHARFDPASAETNVAFVLAHELAHWERDDTTVALLARRDTQVMEFAVADRERIEFTADATAVVDITRAGHDPRKVLDGELLRRWATSDGGGDWYRVRKRSLDQLAASVRQHLPLFEAGTAFILAGVYDDALALLDAFVRSTRYGGREVFANLAFVRLQLAFQLLADCNAPEALRFAIPGLVDTRTGAGAFRDALGAGCREADEARKLVADAIAELERTAPAHEDYAPAYLNLVAAYVLAERFADALSKAAKADERLELSAAQRAALRGSLAVAKYGLGAHLSSRDLQLQARDELRRLAGESPGDAATAYNLARVLSELADPTDPDSSAAAGQAWEHARALDLPRRLALEAARMAPASNGVDDSRRAGAATRPPTRCPTTGPDAPPIALGLVDRGTRKNLPPAATSPLAFEADRLHVYQSPAGGAGRELPARGWTAYAIERPALPEPAVELIVEDLTPSPAAALRERLGPPLAHLALADGRRVWRYDGCAYVIGVDGEQAVQRLVFE